MESTSSALARTGERVVVYGLRGSSAHRNLRFATVQCYDPRRNLFCVTFPDCPDGDIDGLWVDGGHLFFPSMHQQYFPTPYEQSDLLTDFARVVYGGNARPRLVATQRIPIGTVLGCPSLRITKTHAQLADIEAEFSAWASANMPTLMGRPPGPFVVKLERHFNAVLPFVGALAEHNVWKHDMPRTLNHYDPAADKLLAELWSRTNAVNILWFAFWCSKLPHLAPTHVWHVWHFALTFAWPSGDRRSVVVSQMIGSMTNPAERLREYQKVFDGLQDADVDHLAHKCLSSVVLTRPESADRMQAFFLHTVEVGQPVYLDAGTDCSNPCDTVLNCLFMEEFEGYQWINLYRNVLRLLGKPEVVALSLQNFINDNVDRIKTMTSKPAPTRTTPAVHMPPGSLPRCARCAQPLQTKLLCARCKNAAYCSKACQTAAWKTHKPECAEQVD